MRKSLVKLLLAIAVLALPAAVHALGMGGINVTSALGQPLRAEIELVAVGKAERDALVARLALTEAYKSAGLEYPHGNKFKFQIESRADGELYLRVNSEQPINEPFVSLLVEMTWPSGKLLREYTFLLDPPGYVSDQPIQSEVQVVAPAGQLEPAQVVAEPIEGVNAWDEPAQQVIPADASAVPPERIVPAEGIVSWDQAPSDQAASTIAAPERQAVPGEAVVMPGELVAPEVGVMREEIPLPSVEPLPELPEWVTVPSGSTMYELAQQYKQTDTSVERMLVAMYRANADEFDDKNMNRIRAGKILRLPGDEELTDVTQYEAESEIRVQAADWNAYRQKLASAAAVSIQPQALQQVAVGKISSSVIDKAPVAKESAKEVLKLSKGEAPGDQAVAAAGGKGMTEQDRKNAEQEEAIAKAKAAEEEQMRAAMLEQNLKDAQRLAQLKAEAAVLAAKSSGIPAETTAPAVAASSGVKVETTVKPPAKPAVKSQPKPIEPEPTLVDQILGEPLYLAGGAALLLGLGGLGFVFVRRKKKSIFEEGVAPSEDVGSTTGRLAAPVVPSPDTGDFTRSAAAETPVQTQSAQQQESVDPIGEADLFLSFGRDAQAEEILQDALKTMPSNHQIHLKLLGIYASRQDANAFAIIAQQLKDSGDEYAWEQAVEMGRKLDPDSPMYGGGGFRSMEDTGSATVQMAAFNAEQPVAAPVVQPSVLDFDFDVNAQQRGAVSSSEQNLLGDMETTTVLTSRGAAAEQAATMDFDITSTHPSMLGQVEEVSLSPDEIVFDVTGSHSMPAEQPKVSEPESDLGMAFTLDFPVAKPVEKPVSEPAGGGLSGINLNFDEATALSASSSGGKDEHWQEVATKLDLAKAYQEMGDADGAREILNEVLREGDTEQQAAAQALFAQLG